MASRTLLVLLLLCVMAAAASAGQVYSAGGSSGWSLGSQMGSLSVNPGDTVLFSYRQGQHDVHMVSQSDYYNCDSASSYARYSSGNDYVAFPEQGAFYFICSFEGHCSAGMKLAVYVQ